MFKLSLRKKFFRIFALTFCFVVISVATAGFFVAKNNQEDTYAATPEGTNVTVTFLEHSPETYNVYNFSINNGSETIRSYCAETSRQGPEQNSSWPADVVTPSDLSGEGNDMAYKKMKLIMYIDRFAGSNSYATTARNTIFDSWPNRVDDENWYYKFVHFMLSVIYSNDWAWIDDADKPYIERATKAGGLLEQLITSNSDVWAIANNYKLYRIQPGNNQQDLVWIEDGVAYGTLNIKKCDSQATNCIPAPPRTLEGITFKVYNASGSKIYNPSTNRFYDNGAEIASGQTNNSGELTINNLLATDIKYTVKETATTNQYYTLDAAEQNVTFTGSGQTKTLTFYNTPISGKITVKKIDADTGTCTGSNATPFDGITITLKQGSTTISTGTITNPDCTVVFDNLVYGQYTVSESNVPSSYDSESDKPVTLSATNKEATVTFSNTSKKGKITINKTDSVTGQNTPQGKATFDGTKFKIVNKSVAPIYYTSKFIGVNDEVATLELKNGASSASLGNLPYGTYEITEIAVGAGYNRNTTTKTVTIPTNNNTNISTTFANTPILGKLTVKIIDEDTGSCVNTRGLTFNDAEFTVTNKSPKPIYYNGHSIASGASIVVKGYANDNCSITIDDLPVGDYGVSQTEVTPGYSPDVNIYNPSITPENLHPVVTLIDKPFRGDVKFVKKDETNNKPMRDVVFSISAFDEDLNIVETHIVVTNQEGVLDTSSDFALHTNHTNGYDALDNGIDPIPFLGYGTWFGMDELGNPIRTVDNERALPYGKYLIQELKCGANLFCQDVKDQKKTITINSANQVIDLGDWDNACTNFSLDTTATDAKDGDHYIEIGEKVVIEDIIDYCIKPNVDFILKGVLMDKATGEPYLVDGEPIENSMRLRSSEACGQTKMTFTLEGSEELAGKELVVFETLYHSYDLVDYVITKHDDINDASQTVTLIKLVTLATNEATGEKILPLNQDVTIKDHITYCLKPGAEYTLISTLMNKNTGTGMLINSEPVEIETTIIPTEACGEKDVYFQINTSDLGGADLVIFESLYLDDELILEHRDFNNYDETVSVAPPVPDTGFMTRLVADGGNTKIVFVIAGGIIFLGIGGYFTSRYFAKKKFMKKF